ncbi:transporter [Winogradskyella sp. DF17]|uniref:Transporter n=1 Tax=Winogradskyella pelagia TaxID=2819984 RepID=A0ABS3T3W3_9FLAO|nr:transporter [Winogradskyella sp. DF17]
MIILLGVSNLRAQDIQPRVYAPAPVGTNVITLGYTYSYGALLFDKTIPITDTDASIHGINAAYSRATKFLGAAGRFDVVLPLVRGFWDGQVSDLSQSTDRFGMADPVIRYAVFIKGAPALTKEEFSDFEPETIIGLTMRMQVPLGQYDPDRLINLGTNRWTFSPQIGLWHAFRNFTFEAYAGLWLFTDNTNFLGATRSQNPLATLQAHVSYAFNNGLWIAASTRQSFGGAVTTGNGERLDPETNNRVGLSLALPLSKNYVIRLSGTTGLSTTIGNDYTTFGIGCQAVFW